MIIRFRREYLIGHSEASTVTESSTLDLSTNRRSFISSLSLQSHPSQHREVFVEIYLATLATVHREFLLFHIVLHVYFFALVIVETETDDFCLLILKGQFYFVSTFIVRNQSFTIRVPLTLNERFLETPRSFSNSGEGAD